MLIDHSMLNYDRQWERTRWLGWATFQSTVDWGKQPFQKMFKRPTDLFPLSSDPEQKKYEKNEERAIAAFQRYKQLKEQQDGGRKDNSQGEGRPNPRTKEGSETDAKDSTTV